MAARSYFDRRRAVDGILKPSPYRRRHSRWQPSAPAVRDGFGCIQRLPGEGDVSIHTYGASAIASVFLIASGLIGIPSYLGPCHAEEPGAVGVPNGNEPARRLEPCAQWRQAMSQKLFIGGLSFSTSSDRLREFFGQVDGVESASVVTDRGTGASRGFGFVQMATVEAANAAVQRLNGQELDGRALRIELAKPAAEPGRRRDDGGGYRGGHRGSRW